MHDFASFNHEIIAASKIYLSAVSAATFYGRGIFTTVAIYNSKPFQWEKHWQRLIENAETIGIDFSNFPEEKVKDSLSEIINHNNFKKGRARLTFFDESSKGMWQLEDNRCTRLVITTANFRSSSNNLCLTVSPYHINSKSLLSGVKSCNYLENLLVLEKARKNNFDEAIRLNERNEVVSATMANVFWTRSEEVFTPSIDTGALSGTTRDFILKNFQVSEKIALLEELIEADEIFLTSAGIGVARVESLENKIFEQSIIFTKIQNYFNEITR